MKKVNFSFQVLVKIRLVRRICEGVDWRKILKIAMILVQLYLLAHGCLKHRQECSFSPFGREVLELFSQLCGSN